MGFRLRKGQQSLPLLSHFVEKSLATAQIHFVGDIIYQKDRGIGRIGQEIPFREFQSQDNRASLTL